MHSKEAAAHIKIYGPLPSPPISINSLRLITCGASSPERGMIRRAAMEDSTLPNWWGAKLGSSQRDPRCMTLQMHSHHPQGAYAAWCVCTCVCMLLLCVVWCACVYACACL